MHTLYRSRSARTTRLASIVAGFALAATTVFAQQPPIGAPLPSPPPPPGVPQQAPLPYPPPPPPTYPPQELDRVTSPIALYPDPLLAQVLAAATFAPEIPDAARWADQHHYLPPPALTAAIAADQLPWQPPVQALLPFPSVLAMMASSMPWTQELGSAFLAEPQAVMDAVQRMRQAAASYGYLQSNAQVVVRRGPFIEILPANPAYIVVPYYNPAVVFVPPRRGVVVGGAVSFGFGVSIGTAFAPWGWGTTHFEWGNRVLVVNNARWARTWANRATYVHPYAVPRYAVPRAAVTRAPERHELITRDRQERAAAREGRAREEAHRRGDAHERDHDR